MFPSKFWKAINIYQSFISLRSEMDIHFSNDSELFSGLTCPGVIEAPLAPLYLEMFASQIFDRSSASSKSC